MNKILIHSERIKKVGAKIQFQITLPSTECLVEGIIVTVNPNGKARIVPPPPIPSPKPNKVITKNLIDPQTGWLWLRIPENRDVFYSKIVKYENHQQPTLDTVQTIGINGNQEWWFKGTKREFFKINVPVNDTIIQGFYVDRSKARSVDYTLKVYLQTKINEL